MSHRLSAERERKNNIVPKDFVLSGMTDWTGAKVIEASKLWALMDSSHWHVSSFIQQRWMRCFFHIYHWTSWYTNRLKVGWMECLTASVSKKNDSLVLLTFLLIWPVTSSFDSPIGSPSLRLLHYYFLLDRRWSRSFTYVKILVVNNSFNLVLYFWPDRGKEWKML